MPVQWIQPSRFIAPWSPDDIAEGIIWLDAADSDTLTLDGNDVSAWEDKFNSYSFAQATSSAKPSNNVITQNGLVTIDFDGGDYLTYDAGSDARDIDPHTLFIVSRQNAGMGNLYRVFSTRQSVDSWADFYNGMVIWRSSTDKISCVTSSDEPPAGGIAYTAGEFNLWELRYTGSQGQLSKDGGTPTTYTTYGINNQRYIRVGAGCAGGTGPPSAGPMLGAIAEIIMYNSALSTDDETAVRNYLNDKWAIY